MAATSNEAVSLPRAEYPRGAIPAETLLRLPFDVANEFAAVFFAEDEHSLSLGVSHPDLLKANVSEALQVLEKEVGKKIILYQLLPAELKSALKQYKTAASDLHKEQLEYEAAAPNYRVGTAIPADYLIRIPLEYARIHRLIAVDGNTTGAVWFATDRNDESVRTAAELIARRNRLLEKVITVPRKEFERLLQLRAELEEKKPEPAPTQVPVSRPQEPVPKPEQLVPTVALPIKPAVTSSLSLENDQGITEPDNNGTILTGDVEKPGFAGLFQRAAQLFNKSVEVPTSAAVMPPVVPIPLSPAEPPKTEPTAVSPAEPPKTEPTGLPPTVVNEQRPVTVTKVDAKENMPDEQTMVAASGTEDDNALFARPVTDIAQLQRIVREGSIPRTIAGIINLAVERKASDVHIEPFGDELLIRYRVDGQLSEVLRLPMSLQPAMVSRIKILSKLKLDESRIPQDGRFEIVVSRQREVDIRVSTLPTVHGEKVALRLLDKSEGIYSLEKLGLVGDGFRRLVSSIKQAYGVVLSTGPTGSGKTTTLYAILQRVATTNVNVVTLEDPVEYEMKGINQSQIKPKIGFTFAEGLRSVLRQDPNIIMVGEVRDGETAAMVTHAALTGHLVLTTLHTNNAAGALPRLINMGIEPFLITSATNAVMGQRLVRRLCMHCREKFELPPAVRKEIDVDLQLIVNQNSKDAERIPKEIVFHRSVGCSECTSGYRGRVGLYEVLLMSETIEDLAVQKAPAIDIERAAVKEGMITMKQDGILKVLEGITSLDEVLRETSSR